MNGCQSCSFYSRRAWNIFHYFQSWKVKVNLETRYLATPQHPKNRWDICKTFFSDFGCNFLLQEGVFHKCSKSKYHRFRQNNFLAPILAVKNTLFAFFCFFPPCMPIFFKKNYLPILGELRKLHAKIYTFSVKIGREINFQSWLLYDCFFHSCYNFAIVQWTTKWFSFQRWNAILPKVSCEDSEDHYNLLRQFTQSCFCLSPAFYHHVIKSSKVRSKLSVNIWVGCFVPRMT